MVTFNSFKGDPTDTEANAGYKLSFYHVPTSFEANFKAFITSLSDQYQSNWESEEIYGRMDPIQTFKSTTRVINVGWDIVAGSLQEAQRNLKELSTLFNMLYPVYESNSTGTSGMVASPLMRMKFTNLITRAGANPLAPVSSAGLLGTSSGFTFEPQMDDAVFGDTAGNLYPKVVKISCAFSVIHEHPLGWDQHPSPRNPSFPYGSDEQSLPAGANQSLPSEANSSVANQSVPQSNSSQESIDIASESILTSGA